MKRAILVEKVNNDTVLSRLTRWLGVVLLMTSCTATKYLDEGDAFYEGAEIKFETQGNVGGRKRIQNSLLPLLKPEPNTKILGMRPGVWLYYRQRDDEKKKGLKAFIRRKFGQAPVLMKDVDPERTAGLLEGTLINDGYFDAEVEYTVKERDKTASVIYTLFLNPPYRLRRVTYPSPRDSVYAGIVRTLHEKSYLDSGQRYSLSRLKAEQERIEKEVENFGLFYFDDRFLLFEADSTVGYRQVDVRLRMEPGIPKRARRIYTLDEVNVYPGYTLDTDTAMLQRYRVKIDSFNYFDRLNKFRPRVITRVINLDVGNIYSREAHDLTLSHLMDLGVFKFVNIKYAEVYPDSNLLRTNIYLTPLKKKSIRLEFQGVSKSNNFVGPGVSVTFTNRNFLRGAELFQLELNSSYEVQVSRRIARPLNAFELGLESSLTVPRFITPIPIHYNSRRFLPKTDFRISVNLQNRVNFFRLNSFNFGFGYLWRESIEKSHEFFPVDINFVRTDKKAADFERLLERNSFLSRSFEDQFILGTRYSYTLNTQLINDPVTEFEDMAFKEHSIYFSGSVQTAGNVIHAIQKQTRGETEEPFTLFNSPYSQYIRGDVDFRYYWQLDQSNKIATRVVVGTGYAYGNATTLPYIKQFSIGGSNSIRAFPARSIGPGTYYVINDPNQIIEAEDPEGNEENLPPVPVFIDQRGDIKLETNVEFRFDIIKAFKGAVFVDAGNIWLIREDESRPGGKFDKDTFLKQFAVGTGLGFRFDFSFFVLRFDIAFPLRKPYLIPENRNPWVLDQINPLDPTWRKDNLIFNIAIGYPF